MTDLDPAVLASILDITPAEFSPGFPGKTRRLPNGASIERAYDTYCGVCCWEGPAEPGATCPECGKGTILRDDPDDREED